MQSHKPTVIIGAGPYGLSIAAHLKSQQAPMLIFGKTMEFWRAMPSDLYLKSSWSASTLFDPAEQYSLSQYYQNQNIAQHEPISLQNFLAYGEWFQRQAVADVDETYVQSIARDGQDFQVELADGRSVKAGKVVVATGIANYAYIPEFARHLSPSLASHTQQYGDLTKFKGRKIAVLGGGQSGLEYAAMAYEAGADVEIITRKPIIWISRKLYQKGGPLQHLFYPPSDVGPPGMNWLIAMPVLFSQMPNSVRRTIDERAVRPAGARWLRPRVEGHIRQTINTSIIQAEEQDNCLRLTLSDGTTREVDHLLMGTGYYPDVERIPFIDAKLGTQVSRKNGRPVLNKWFESSVPNLYFAGALAGYTFGPICRFVSGAREPARQIARHATQIAWRSAS